MDDPEVEPGASRAPRLTITIVSLFPQLFDSWLSQGVVSRAMDRGIATIELLDLRPFGIGKHHITDDYAFGGGPGMVMKPEPLFAAVTSLDLPPSVPVILLSPLGKRFTQSTAEQLSARDRLVLIAGHYEGVDERVRASLIDEEISIGDFVLSCGELAAMIVSDAVVRLLPGALTEGASAEESFSGGLLEYPHYTRPASFQGHDVPDVLLSGHHAEIARWRRRAALKRTFLLRPDLLSTVNLTREEQELVREWEKDRHSPC